MKILIVNTRHTYGGGDSRYSFNLADLLSSHGHEVAFFAMQDERNIPDVNSDLFVSSIEFRELNHKKNLANGIRVLTRSIYSIEARQKFAKLLDRFSPDIIHLQNFIGHITLSILFEAERRNLPVVWTLHDYGLICPNAHFLIDQTGQICEACKGGHFYQAIIKQCKKNSILASSMAAFVAYCNRWMGLLKKVDIFISPSCFLKTKLLQNGFSENKIHHLPLFLPQEYFYAGEQDNGYFLFLGRLEAFKGINILIEASKIASSIPIVIAGSVSEPLASQLTEILPRNARYIGQLHGQELADVIHNAFAIIMPSICYENQPFSILEGFASGKAVIASDLGGMAELVADQERGLLVKPGDSLLLANAMLTAASNPSLMKAMGKSAREYAIKFHGPELHYQTLTNIYSQVMRSQTK
jgi:glycosyltransferase involved in cell wall biosynthesis